jgi:hypothetical protein
MTKKPSTCNALHTRILGDFAPEAFDPITRVARDWLPATEQDRPW